MDLKTIQDKPYTEINAVSLKRDSVSPICMRTATGRAATRCGSMPTSILQRVLLNHRCGTAVYK